MTREELRLECIKCMLRLAEIDSLEMGCIAVIQGAEVFVRYIFDGTIPEAEED